MSNKKIQVLLADDHAVVRQGFRLILSAESEMEIVGEAANGREAADVTEGLQPDVVVMDVALPELNGIEATRRLASTSARTRVLALSMHKDSVYVREILRAVARVCQAVRIGAKVVEELGGRVRVGPAVPEILDVSSANIASGHQRIDSIGHHGVRS